MADSGQQATLLLLHTVLESKTIPNNAVTLSKMEQHHALSLLDVSSQEFTKLEQIAHNINSTSSSSLPPELVRRVLDHLSQVPRLVSFKGYPFHDSTLAYPPKRPAPFSIDFQTRIDAQQAYLPLFSRILGWWVDFNPLTDTLLIGQRGCALLFNYSFAPCARRSDFDKVRSVALTFPKASEHYSIVKILSRYFTSLERLFVVFDAGQELESGYTSVEDAAEKLKQALAQEEEELIVKSATDGNYIKAAWTNVGLPAIQCLTLVQLKEQLGSDEVPAFQISRKRVQEEKKRDEERFSGKLFAALEKVVAEATLSDDEEPMPLDKDHSRVLDFLRWRVVGHKSYWVIVGVWTCEVMVKLKLTGKDKEAGLGSRASKEWGAVVALFRY
ncbi:hypothetical protein B0J14DRAFT_694124 [Halenospora varia]|nr:hypothetical protein B0J14DRAFT_694124 [Halenospora varia]